jgi:hypothetical protein
MTKWEIKWEIAKVDWIDDDVKVDVYGVDGHELSEYDVGEWDRILAEMVKRGWELINAEGCYIYYFKRSIE